MQVVENLLNVLFKQTWAPLHATGALNRDELRYPGVYLLRFAPDGLIGTPVLPQHVLYIGMSNSAGGVKQRLRRFKNGVTSTRKHCAAPHFLREYNGDELYNPEGPSKFYFAATTLECNSDKGEASPADFQKMGHICCLEQYAIAKVLADTGATPKLNRFTSTNRRT